MRWRQTLLYIFSQHDLSGFVDYPARASLASKGSKRIDGLVLGHDIILVGRVDTLRVLGRVRERRVLENVELGDA